MLVISRKPGEKLFVGDDIIVTVLEVKGNRVRLGIDAPADVPLLRSELHPSATSEERQDLHLAPTA